ncbi:uncharacterized protein LOC129375781 [Poeciliopsis prolifica]|uniref:uncharacterized protein LOC129375781 n=1 Tax=Poeciliopsis prolifica TaxID=188132 RepID=UPI002412FEED|nr:uncharacterized protein LOC129375781 [Poeciliopsis prolifica]
MRTARLRIRRERRVLTGDAHLGRLSRKAEMGAERRRGPDTKTRQGACAWILWQHVNALAARGGVRENPSATAGTPSCSCKPAARTRTSTVSHERGELRGIPWTPRKHGPGSAQAPARPWDFTPDDPLPVRPPWRNDPPRRPGSGERSGGRVVLTGPVGLETGPVTSGGSRLRLPDARGRCAPRGGSTRPPIRQDLPASRGLAPGWNPPTGPRRPRLCSEFRTDGFPGGSLLSGHVVALRRPDRASPAHGPAAGAEQRGRVPGRRPENRGLSRS